MAYKRVFMVFLCFTLCYGLLMQLDVIKKLDLLVNKWSYTLSNTVTDIFWRLFTWLGDTETLALLSVLIIIFLLWQKRIQEMILFISVITSGVLITFLLKVIIQKERPGEVEYIDFLGFGKETISYSFPSGHAVKSLLLFGFLIWLIRKDYLKNHYTISLTLLLLIGIIFCGIGQIYLHEHYLSDVIGGYLIGITIHSYSLWLYYWWSEKQKQSTLPYRNAQ